MKRMSVARGWATTNSTRQWLSGKWDPIVSQNRKALLAQGPTETAAPCEAPNWQRTRALKDVVSAEPHRLECGPLPKDLIRFSYTATAVR